MKTWLARDRRSPNRQPDPACPHCARVNPTATLRTSHVVYYLCDGCGTVWNVDWVTARFRPRAATAAPARNSAR
jgi:hypothetical protein